ncbi:MAG: hypothetical protein R6V04_13040 [bacterium]
MEKYPDSTLIHLIDYTGKTQQKFVVQWDPDKGVFARRKSLSPASIWVKRPV